MNLTFNHIICIILFGVALTGRAQNQFTKAYGGNWNEPYHFAPGMLNADSDGGFILCHSTQSHGLPSTNAVFLIRTDSNGDTVLIRSFYRAAGGMLTGRAAHEMPDGGYSVVADLAGSEMVLLKTDASGIPQWTKMFAQSGRHGRRLTNGDMIMCGGTKVGALVRVDGSGTIIFAKTYGLPLPGPNVHTLLWSVYECSNGDLVATGSVQYNTSADRDIFLLRTDHAGNIKFARKYGTSSHDEFGMGITEMPNRQIAVTGYCTENGKTQGDVPLLVTDSAGSVVSYNRVGDTLDQHANSVVVSNTNELFLAGVTAYSATSSISRSGLVIKTATSGAINAYYRFDDAQYGAGILLTAGKSVVVSGTSNKLGAGLSNIVLMKTDSSMFAGCSVVQFNYPTVPVTPDTDTLALSISTITGVSNPTFEVVKGSNVINYCAISSTLTGLRSADRSPENIFLLYPNPASGNVVLNSVSEAFDRTYVTDQTGRMVLKNKFQPRKCITINVDGLDAGVYMITVENDHSSVTRRLMISR